MMRFVFEERRAAQAASVLLERAGGAMEYIKLIKLLYLADRAALIETGSPITGDRFVSMKYGPVLSNVLNLIKEPKPREDSIWHRYIERRRFDAVLMGSAECDRLAKYETDLLNGIFDSYGDWKPWAVVNHTHSLPEWRDPGETSIAIDPAEILRFAGYSDDAVDLAIGQSEASLALSERLAVSR